MRVRRTKAEIEAGVTLEQAKALRGTPVSKEAVLAELGDSSTWAAEEAETMTAFHKRPSVIQSTSAIDRLIERLRASQYDGGYCPAVFAAKVLEYLTGKVDKDEFETEHFEIFR